jgi:hypothetical protein
MMPTFLIAGPARCGTTSVYQYLRQHPQVFMSRIKETNFFAYLALKAELESGRAQLETPVRSMEEYTSQFSAAGNARARGEASTWYLRAPGTACQIAEHIPAVKLIFILRNPAERAYSAGSRTAPMDLKSAALRLRFAMNWRQGQPDRSAHPTPMCGRVSTCSI